MKDTRRNRESREDRLDDIEGESQEY